ncbi:MAG: hypothetical protein AMK75_03550 [Planctomycetes bacterium SM23_65]|nr:MAG: hypothetical protein AMK75_03550 [Planctomycetes bacterium SM23_65]
MTRHLPTADKPTPPKQRSLRRLDAPKWSLFREIDFRPLLLPTCAFIAGVILHEYVPGLSFVVLLAACVLITLVPLVYFLTRRRIALGVVVILLCATCGYLRHAHRHEVLAPDDVSRLVPSDGSDGALLRVRGVISTRPRRTETPADHTFRLQDRVRTRFHLSIDAVETRYGWEPASGTVQVNVYDRADDFAYGDRIEILARFTRPWGTSSPGEFDYRRYLLRHGIRLRASLTSREALGPIIEHHHGNLLGELAHGIGARLGRIIDRYHSPREAGLLRCILLGERGAVDEETERTFRLSGLSHLLTVSGLHVVVLMGGLWLALRFFLVPQRVSAAVVIAATVLYAAMAGLQPSVVRAAVVTVKNPDEVFFAGFQLSFVAVLGLVGLSPGLYHFLSPRMGFKGLDLLPGAHHWLRLSFNRFFIATLAITAAAWIASQPLVAYHFRVLNPITLGLNLLLMPLFGAILLVGFVVLIIETIFGGLLVAFISDFLVKLLLGLSWTGARLPGAWVNFASPPAWTLSVYYALLLLTAAAPALGLRRRRIAVLVLVFLCALVGRQLLPAKPKTAELVILDVGQGSAGLIRSPEGGAALIDVGTYGSSDISRWTVIPYLIRSRIPTLDFVLLSHADTDHTSSLPRLLDNFRVKKVLLCETFQYTGTGARVERFLLKRRMPFEYVARGDAIQLGSVRLEVLHPPRDRPLLWTWTENGRSAVVRGVTPGGTFILFADAAGNGFWHLAATNDLTADVVLAAHHGGFSGMEMLAADYRWPVVLFSAGRGFIKPERLKAYQQSGAQTLATCDYGTITVRFRETPQLETYRKPPGR